MEFRHLHQIAAIVRAGSFSAAARRLGVTQPALSKSIAILEAELTIQLFDRSSGTARPTQHGCYLAERAESLLESFAALISEVEQWPVGKAGTLRIGIGPVTRIKPLPEVLDHIVQHFPNLRVHVRQELGAALPNAVARGEVDLAFSYHRNADRQGDLMRVKLFEDRFVVAARPGHPVFALSSLSARAMLCYPIASYGDLPAFRRMVGPLGPEEEANLTAFISDDDADIRRVAEQTDALARVPRFVLAAQLAAGRLIEVPISWEATYECWMLTTPNRWRSPMIKAIADFARNVGDKVSPPADDPRMVDADAATGW